MANKPDCCHACAKDIEGESVTCQGFCSGTYHAECCSVNVDFLLQVINFRQTFWMCKSCTSMMNDIRLRRSVKSAYQAGQASMLGDHKELVKHLKSEIITEVKAELQLNFAKLVNSSSHTPKSSSMHSGRRTANAWRRRLFVNQPTRSTSTHSNQPPLATGNDASPSLGNLVAPRKAPKFWLYLSRAARNVTVEQVTTLATSRLGTSNVEVYCLVAKGRDISRLSFISFKIGMDQQLKEKALSLSTWPAGLVVREFENRSDTNENFWQPPTEQSPTPNVEQITIEEDPDAHHTPTPVTMTH